jgi:glycosyltransferase involved in cell wall biosynthesis
MENAMVPKVSVIVPVFNVEKYLPECLDSVLKQSLNDIEVICIEDGSTDSSLQILQRYESADKRVKVFQNITNKGLSYSRNRGLEVASGHYIYFLDSDDMITEDALKKLYRAAENEKTDIIYFDAELIYENDDLAQKHKDYVAEYKRIYDEVYCGEDLFTEFIMNDDWNPSPPRQFFRTEFLKQKKITFYEGILHEDHLFWFTAIIKAERTLCLYERLFVRRYREASITTVTMTHRNFEGLFVSFCELLLFWKASNYKLNTRKAFNKYIAIIFEAAEYMYDELISRNEEVVLETTDLQIQYLFKITIFYNINSRINQYINEDKIKQIRDYKSIIIYGAGIVAREVINVLDKNNIGVLGFAVSDNERNPDYIMGNKVYLIDDLLKYKDESLVIIATTPKYYNDITKMLYNLKFKYVVNAMDSEEYDYSNITGS